MTHTGRTRPGARGAPGPAPECRSLCGGPLPVRGPVLHPAPVSPSPEALPAHSQRHSLAARLGVGPERPAEATSFPRRSLSPARGLLCRQLVTEGKVGNRAIKGDGRMSDLAAGSCISPVLTPEMGASGRRPEICGARGPPRPAGSVDARAQGLSVNIC